MRQCVVITCLLFACDDAARVQTHHDAVEQAMPATTVAAPISLPMPVVPPLLAGERSPTEPPNYFDAREFGSRTAGLVYVCQVALASGDAGIDDEDWIDDSCFCTGDWARKSWRSGGSYKPGAAVGKTCATFANSDRDESPYAGGLAINTRTIVAIFGACVDAIDDLPLTMSTPFCGCLTDAKIHAGLSKPVSERDIARCEIAARYRHNANVFLTKRQFDALGSQTASAPAVNITSAPLTNVYEGPFIPYAGNGGGPTPCADGMWSNSSGSGTCSHHGGMAGGRGHHRH